MGLIGPLSPIAMGQMGTNGTDGTTGTNATTESQFAPGGTTVIVTAGHFAPESRGAERESQATP